MHKTHIASLIISMAIALGIGIGYMNADIRLTLNPSVSPTDSTNGPPGASTKVPNSEASTRDNNQAEVSPALAQGNDIATSENHNGLTPAQGAASTSTSSTDASSSSRSYAVNPWLFGLSIGGLALLTLSILAWIGSSLGLGRQSGTSPA